MAWKKFHLTDEKQTWRDFRRSPGLVFLHNFLFERLENALTVLKKTSARDNFERVQLEVQLIENLLEHIHRDDAPEIRAQFYG